MGFVLPTEPISPGLFLVGQKLMMIELIKILTSPPCAIQALTSAPIANNATNKIKIVNFDILIIYCARYNDRVGFVFTDDEVFG